MYKRAVNAKTGTLLDGRPCEWRCQRGINCRCYPLGISREERLKWLAGSESSTSANYDADLTTHDLSPTVTDTPGEVTPNLLQSNRDMPEGDELISRPSLPTDGDSKLLSPQATSAMLLDGEYSIPNEYTC